MNHGKRAENIFLTDNNCTSFINLLQKTVEARNIKISVYCLMSNHYYLLVQTPDRNLSRCIGHINGVYTQRFNRFHEEEEGQVVP